MNLRKYIYIIFLTTFFQSPIFAKNTEEKIFYEQILNFYEVNDMQKFYNLLAKFQQAYPQSLYKNTLFTLAAKKLYENKKYKDALFFFERIDKNSLAKMQNYYAECNLKLKNYNQIVDFYEKLPQTDLKAKQLLTEAYIGIANSKSEHIIKRREALANAIIILESQTKDTLSSEALLTLAKLYIQSEQFKKSAYILKQLLNCESQNKEEVLLQLSLVQTKYNPDQALKTLSMIIAMKGKYKEIASHKKMTILFAKNQYKELITARNELEVNLGKDKLPLFHYYLGVAFLKNKELTEAEKQFNIYLSDTKSFTQLKLSAFKSLKEIARKKKDTTLLKNINISLAIFKREKTAILLKSKISRDDSLDLSKALTLKKDKRYDAAENHLKNLLQTPNNKEKTAIHFELAHLYYLNSQYEEAKNTFISFIRNNSNSTLIPLAWNYYLESSMNLAKNPNNEYAKAHLMNDVMLCLRKNSHLNHLERAELLFLLARTQYELKAFEEAITTTKYVIKNNKLSKDTLSKCYLILGYSYKNAFEDKKSFISFIKKAAEINPNLMNNEKIQTILGKNSNDEIKVQVESKNQRSQN